MVKYILLINKKHKSVNKQSHVKELIIRYNFLMLIKFDPDVLDL